jgi:hypothetical protein
MPLEYQHPEIKPTHSGRQRLKEHRLVMEEFLKQNPHLEKSKKYLIDGKYLKSSTEVHHINQDKLDNRIENLWLFPSSYDHGEVQKSLNKCLSVLIKIEQITFNNGEYKFNSSFDYRERYKGKEWEFREITRPVEFKVPFEDINEIREEIKNKKWKWYEIYDNWKVNKRGVGAITLNPYEDCSESNPLYMHEGWLKKIVNDVRFDFTDSRLGQLCGLNSSGARYWRWVKHRIPNRYRLGAYYWKRDKSKIPNRYRLGTSKTISKEYIEIKIPKSYKNPFAEKQKNYDVMLEHRYIAERALEKSSNSLLKSECLLDGKYLLPNCIVHHINLDKLDNRLENLWITKDHRKVHRSLDSLVKQLLDSGLLKFSHSKYFL